jgi:hypothetical protein
MRSIRPKPPQNLNPLCRELLECLAGHAEAAEIVLGGGVALSNYLEYRETVDLDAWWRESPLPEVLAFLEGCMKALAAKHGLDYRRRTWGETESLELLRGSQKLFSFQISQRTRYLDQPVPSAWQPVLIETLRDNVASKMTALVERGAPRDLRDVFQLCHHGIATIDECWSVWRIKNPQREPSEGPEKVLFYIEKLELMRPLDKLPQETRSAAAALRQWYRDVFCPAGPE